MGNTAKITFDVQLDANKVPEMIKWEATDNNVKSTCKAALISLWDEKESNQLRIDLWTKDMRVDEMKKFFHQTLVTMADTLERATNEHDMAADMRDFCHHFAEKMEVGYPEES